MEDHPDDSADNTDSTADLSETDLAAIELSPTDADAGTLTLQLSDPSAVRLFAVGPNDPAGTAHEIFAAGHGEDGNLVVNLADNGLASSQLFSGGGRIYLEGLQPARTSNSR